MDKLKDILKNFQTFNTFSKKSPKGFGDNYLITLEGIEGCGKSTQVQNIKKFLENKGYHVHLLREPGGTTFGEKLREAILEQREKLNPLAEAYLFASARAQLIEEKILKLLHTSRNIILLDRYIDSSILYQGMAAGLSVETILEIHRHPPLNVLPDLTLYLDISVAKSMERTKARGEKSDYFEEQKEELLEKLSQGGKKLCQLFPRRIRSINGEASFESVFQNIKSEINHLLGQAH